LHHPASPTRSADGKPRKARTDGFHPVLMALLGLRQGPMKPSPQAEMRRELGSLMYHR
jgi:hypothetical protein